MTTTSSAYDKVVICSGHIVDAPDRKEARSPETKAEAVRAKMAIQLAKWEIGARDLAICGGACGADILFGEETLRRGAQLRLLLAQEIDAFIRNSVQHAGEHWVRRFHALCGQAKVEILPRDPSGPPNDISIYGRNNLWIIETARTAATDPHQIHALLVWDEKPTGDGPGGTSDFQKKVCQLGASLEIINPTKLP